MSWVKRLKSILGSKKVKEKEEYLHLHSYDATRLSFLPDVVVFPESEKDVLKVVEFSREHKIPITPRGAGVGYSGGALPLKRGISLVFTKMNRIKELSVENSYAIVEPGTTTVELQREAEKVGLFYPPDPASLKTSTIGGNIAENAGGPRCFKYGVTGNYVLSLKVVLPEGKIIRLGSPTIKDVTGYNLKSLIIGSEGTLAIIVEATMRLIPLPEMRAISKIGFKSLKEASEAVIKILASNLFPSALEFMDESSIRAVYKHFKLKVPENIKTYILLEFDGEKETVISSEKKLKNVLKSFDIQEFTYSTSKDEMEKIWEIRRAISPAIMREGKIKVNEDITVPIGQIPYIVDFIKKLGSKYNIETILFGHIGDGNIHTNFMITPDEKEKVEKLLNEMFKEVVKVGGTLSGEHGIGITKKKYIPLQLEDEQIQIIKKIKSVFDPLNILNPGKIIPD